MPIRRFVFFRSFQSPCVVVADNIPTSLFRCDELVRLSVSNSSIVGAVSDDLGRLVNLTELHINDWGFEGLMLLCCLFELERACFAGEFPVRALEQMPKLRNLSISATDITSKSSSSSAFSCCCLL